MASWITGFGSFLRVIFARESLPSAPQPPPRLPRRGTLSLLLAPEPLPEDPPAAERPRSRWLTWLFAPERLDE